jgi:hypothetical protein
MKRTYYCPKCQATLNPSVKIILTATHEGKSGIVLLSPQPGNYRAIIPEELKLGRGDLVEFRCPVCNADLTSDADPRMAHLRFRFSTGTSGYVEFARRFGEHATYFVTEQSIRSFGPDAEEQGFNFFGAGHEED